MDDLKSFWQRITSWFSSGLPAEIEEDPTFPGRYVKREKCKFWSIELITWMRN